MTERRLAILDFIKAYHAEHGYSPSIRDLAGHFQMTTNGMVGHLKSLVAAGMIKMDSRIARSIVVLGAESYFLIWEKDLPFVMKTTFGVEALNTMGEALSMVDVVKPDRWSIIFGRVVRES